MRPIAVPRIAQGGGLLVLSCLVLSSCERHVSPESPGFDTAAEIAAIDSLRSLYERSVASGDFSTMARMLAEGAVMVGPGGPKWDSLRAASELPWPPGATLEIAPIETVVISPEWAYDFGTSRATYVPQGETERVTLHDTFLLLLRNTGDGWKIYREVASPNLPPGVSPE